ncbi:MAG TPA: hypothetical protein VLD67_08635 [Vicinamibacterales bacterium]|nr:hypothetical protein [Vicinamibacterales bacterium]
MVVTRTYVDPDLWGHLRFGLDMLATGAIHSTDVYSFTSDRAWVNHEWLSELLMGLAYTPLGSTGLILLKLAVIAAMGRIFWLVATRENARPLARDLFVCFAVFTTYTRTQVVRPQMFSVAVFCLMLYILRQADRGRTGWLWGLPPLFAAWANLHGAWIVGLGALSIWAAGDMWQARDPRRAATIGAILSLSILATLLNPYGIGLWQFVAETVRPGRPDITDWKPLLELPPAVLIVESILPLAAVAALWRGRSAKALPVRDLAVIALLIAATIRVGRVDAFLQSAIAILLAPQLIALLHGVPATARATLQRKSVSVATLGLAIGAYAMTIGLGNVRLLRVEGRWIPDRAAAVLLREARPGARVLTWFDWGEYALWQLSPAGILVSMDGRRETVYSDEVVADHFRFYGGSPDMVDYPDRIGADHVWLPSHFPVIDRLSSAGWTRILDTGKSVVLARKGEPIAYRPDAESGPNAFPWP